MTKTLPKKTARLTGLYKKQTLILHQETKSFHLFVSSKLFDKTIDDLLLFYY